MGKVVYMGFIDEVIPSFINPVSDDYLSSSDIIPCFSGNNLFPEEMTSLARQSAYWRGVINSKVTYCAGAEFESTDQKFLDLMNEMRLHDTFKRLLLDDFITGNSYIEIVTDVKKSFVKIFHQDTTKPRVATNFEGFILNPDWASRKTELDVKIPVYPKFVKDKNGLLHSLIHIKSYEPGFKYYGIPNNYAGMKAAVIDFQADRWNKERLENNFSIDGLMIIPGVDTPEEAKKILKDINENNTGAKNAGKIRFVFQKTLNAGEQKEKPEFVGLKDKDDGSWLEVNKLASEKILIANGWYASLAAFPEATGFDTNRILNDYKIAKLNVINPVQELWIGIFTKIFSDFGFNSEFSIKNIAPIDEVDNEVLTINERREMLGKEPIEGGDVLLNKQNVNNSSPNNNTSF